MTVDRHGGLAGSGALLAVLATALSAKADPGVLLRVEPGSTFSYLVAGFSPVPDCDGNDDRQCDFGVTGSLRFDGEAITQAALTLTSPVPVDPVLPAQLTTADRVEEFLEGLTWLPALSLPGTASFFATNLPPGGDLLLSYDAPPTRGAPGSLSGGYDARPIDGDGAVFALVLTVVPEPATASIAALVVIGIGAVGRPRGG